MPEDALYLPPAPRRVLADLPPVAHGALDFVELERLGLAARDVIDFSSNTNPYGPPPAVRQAIRQALTGEAGQDLLERYPDRQSIALRRALSAHLDLPPEGILPGNGAAELIWLVALAYLEPGDPVLVIGPTFGEYANAARSMGAEVETWHGQDLSDFQKPERYEQVDEITRQIEQRPYRLVFLCNPNNPTGGLLPAAQIIAWAAAHPKTLFVIDEAYLAFVPQAFVPQSESCIGSAPPNLLVLRSMTKDYALAGLRLGYAVGHPQAVQALRKIQPPWSANALAQVAGIAALQDPTYISRCVVRLHQHKRNLLKNLVKMGLAPQPSAVHFFLMPVGNGVTFRAALARRGVLVRDCASFGLPEYVRIAVRTPAENEHLLIAVKETIT